MRNFNKIFSVLFLCLMFLFAEISCAQKTIAGSPRETILKSIDYFRASRLARRYFQEKNYNRAAEILGQLVRENPEDGNNWLMLAATRYQLKQYKEAIEPYIKSSELGFLDAAQAAYQIARCHSLLGDKNSAFEWLAKALQLRYRYRPRIAGDDAFKSLRDDPRFLQIAGLIGIRTPNRVRGWKRDLDYLIAEVKRVHYRYSREPLPPGFLQTAAIVRRNFARLSDAEIVVKFQRLLALLGDGHTLVYPFGMKLGSLKRLPLSFYLFSDGLFVIDAPEELKYLIGRKVLKFGRTSTEDVMKDLGRLVSRDNSMSLKWAGVLYLTFPDFLKELGVVNGSEQISLLLEDARAGGRREITIPAREFKPDEINVKLIPARFKNSTPNPLYLSRVKENYWLQKLDRDTVYFQFNQTQNRPDEPLSAFSHRLRRFLDENNTKNLIIDVRHNNGGEANLLGELYRTLVHFETTRNQARIYVLIGRDTFSAAQTFVSTINYLTSAIYVGEPTGSKSNRVGDETLFVLPVSGIVGSIASGYNQAASKDSRIWIAPDIPVELSSTDYFNNRDPVLETVQEILRKETD